MKDKEKNVVIIILIILIILLGAVCGYLLLKKINNQEGNDIVYVSDDGKYHVQLFDISDEKLRGEAKEIYYNYFKEKCESDKNYMEYFDGVSCSTLDNNFDSFFKDNYKFKGYAYVNDKLIEIIELYENDEYISVIGDDVNGGAQCYSYSFLINKKNNKIEKYNNGMYRFIQNEDVYYITKTMCESEIVTVYTKDFKELGEQIIDKLDNSGNVYVKKDNIIYKYNQNGDELKKSNKLKDIGNGVFYNNTLYVVIKENGKAYLLNMDTFDKVFITNRNDTYPLADSTSLSIKDNQIIITMYFDYSKDFTYDPVKKKIIN